MLKVLTFIDWFWPGYKAGGPVRSLLNMTEHLSDGIEFYIVTRNTDYMSDVPYENVDSDRWVEIRPNINVYYISRNNLTRKRIRSFIREADRYDAIYINGIYSLYFSILPLYFSRKSKVRHIVAPRGMLSGQTFSSKKLLKKAFFLAGRITGLYRNTWFHATIEKEADDITKTLKVNPGRITIAPNLPRQTGSGKIPQRLKNPGKMRLISIARIAPEKNILFAVEMLKGMKHGDIRFDLYGEIYNQDYWKECQEVIKLLPAGTLVEYKGSIRSDDIPEVLPGYHFLLMPSRGENFGHSILESLMSGCPVIISDKTPWRELKEKQAGWDIDLRQPGMFIEALDHCLEMQQDEYDNLSAGALELARAFVNDSGVLAQSKKLFYGKD